MWWKLLSFIGLRPGVAAVGLIGAALLALISGGSAIYHSKMATSWENKATLYEQNIKVRDGIISSLSEDLILLNGVAKEKEERAKRQAEQYAEVMRKYDELRERAKDVDAWWTTPLPDELRELWYKNRPR